MFLFRKYGPHQLLESNYPLEPQNANALLSPRGTRNFYDLERGINCLKYDMYKQLFSARMP